MRLVKKQLRCILPSLFLLRCAFSSVVSALSGPEHTIRSVPTSRFYLLVYQDFLQHTGTSHKLPALFTVLFVPECLLAINYIRVHYMTLASLFSRGLRDAHLFVFAEVGRLH